MRMSLRCRSAATRETSVTRPGPANGSRQRWQARRALVAARAVADHLVGAQQDRPERLRHRPARQGSRCRPGTTSCSSSASRLSEPSLRVGSTIGLDGDVVRGAADVLAQAEQHGGGQARHREGVAERDRRPAAGATRPSVREASAIRAIELVSSSTALRSGHHGRCSSRRYGRSPDRAVRRRRTPGTGRGVTVLARERRGCVPCPASTAEVEPADRHVLQVLDAEAVVRRRTTARVTLLRRRCRPRRRCRTVRGSARRASRRWPPRRGASTAETFVSSTTSRRCCTSAIARLAAARARV